MRGNPIYRIHKDDREALKALLNAAYVDEDEYVDMLWRTVCKRLETRNGVVAVLYWGQMRTIYGPFSDVAATKKPISQRLNALGENVYVELVNVRAPADLYSKREE